MPYTTISEQLARSLHKRHLAGATQVALANEIGVTPPTISKAFNRYGLTERPLSQHKRHREEVVRRYRDGESAAAIAADIGVAPTLLYAILAEAGVPVRNPGWGSTLPIGATKPSEDGYVVEKVDTAEPCLKGMRGRGGAGGWMLQHRVVMARHLGRPLRTDEQVHHINGDRADNRVENLQLINGGRHPAGQALRCRGCGSVDLEPYEVSRA